MSADDLQNAQNTERMLREQLADLISAKKRAESEHARLQQRAALPGADGALAELAVSYQAQADRLGPEIEITRASLRTAEADVERLKADAG